MLTSDLISPHELTTFISENWGNGPFLVPGNESKSGVLPSISDLIVILSGSCDGNLWRVPNAQTFNASRVENDGKITQSQNLPVHLAPEYYNQGFAICFGDVSDISPELEELKKDTESLNDLFSNVLITCYLTPAMSTGVLHFDRQHNFFIQREGVKRWTVSRQPAVSNPIDNLVYPGSSDQFFSVMRKRGYSIKLPSECGKEVITLHPGDVLYLPPGHYHSPETTDSASLHYTLTLEPISFWSLIRPSLSRALLANSECFNKDLRFLSIEERESHIAAQKKLLADFILQLTTDKLKMMLAESGTDSSRLAEFVNETNTHAA